MSEEENYFDSEEDFEPSEEELSEEIPESEIATDESDIEDLNIFPITAHRQKYIVRFAEFEY